MLRRAINSRREFNELRCLSVSEIGPTPGQRHGVRGHIGGSRGFRSPEYAELVAVGIGHHRPVDLALADVDSSGSQRLETVDLRSRVIAERWGDQDCYGLVGSTTDRTFVLRVRNGKTEWVDVRTGLASGPLTEVFGDLRPGDQIAVRGTDEIKPGTEVRVKEVTPT